MEHMTYVLGGFVAGLAVGFYGLALVVQKVIGTVVKLTIEDLRLAQAGESRQPSRRDEAAMAEWEGGR